MNDDTRTDAAVAASVQQGNKDDFALLIERYREKMLRYARRFLADYDAREDAVQDVFVKAYVNMQSFDTNMPFSPWIYRIAHNTYINVIKKAGREPITFFNADTLLNIPSSESLEGGLIAEEERAAVDQHVRSLDPKYREPLILFYFESKSYKEIADILRIPVSTVGIRVKRGRERIRKNFEY